MRVKLLAITLLLTLTPVAANAAAVPEATPPSTAANAIGPDDCVILLHGLRRSAWAMGKLEKALRDSGYTVYNKDYPSTQDTVQALAASTITAAVDFCREQAAERIHFVTHSMGGILVRNYLQDQHIEELGRIVMLAPPNRGSEIVDTIGHWALFRAMMGPAGQQLGTGSNGIAAQLGPIPGEIGIVAGDRTLDPWLSWMIPGEDDGKVSLTSAVLPEMRDFLVVPASHPTIMRKRKVIEQVETFLAHGYFAHES